jgi:anti-anti-sigma factor
MPTIDTSPAKATCVDGGLVTVTVSATMVLDGELDCSTERELERRMSRLAESADVIQIDTRQVSFIDAAGVRTLVLAKQDLVEHGATVTVQISRPGPVQRILHLVGLTGWVD